jgi:hypothetical protein
MSALPSSRRVVDASFALALVTTAAGCPLLEAEVELSEVCMTYADLEIAGVPAGVPTSIDETFTFDDLSAFDALADLDADARFLSATVRATSGVDTLGFVDTASVEIASNDPDSTLPTRMIYSCDGDCRADGDALAIPAQDQPDALDYIRSGSLAIALRVSGTMPTEDWTMDVEICVAGHASYAFDP